jgi:acid phosphatase class B
VIAPQVPAGRPVGQVIFDHHTHGYVDHPPRVMTTGWGYIGQIDVEMLTTCATVVRRVGSQEVHWATGASIAKVVQGALVGWVARGEIATSWAGGLLMITAIKAPLWDRQVFDIDNTLGGVWHVFTWSKHRWLP